VTSSDNRWVWVSKRDGREEEEIGEIRGSGYEGIFKQRQRGRRYILIYFIE
jgi:hypothetical protein